MTQEVATGIYILITLLKAQQTQHICVTFVAQRLQRWSNIVKMLYKGLVLDGSALDKRKTNIRC